MDNKPKKSKKKIKKVKPKKYYAIKVGKGVENLIVESWSECSKLVLGYNSTYKSFLTREEAELFLKNVRSRNEKYEPNLQLKISDSIGKIEESIVENKNNYSLSDTSMEKLRLSKEKEFEINRFNKSKIRHLDVKIPRETYEEFKIKCESMDMSMNKVIKVMIDEWID